MPSLFKEIFQQVFRRFVKDRGRFPTPAERDTLQDIAQKEARKQMENIDPVFKGVDKMDPDKPFRGFKPKVVPKEGELSVTIEGKTQSMSPEGIMDLLMGKGKAKVETEAEMLARMRKQNKESVERLKKKKEKDLAERLKDFDGDPDAMAMGGRAGYSSGGLLKLLKMLQGKVGKKNITTADKMDRPESAKLRDEFKAFNKRNRKLTEDELDELYEEFGESVPYPMETVADRDKFLKLVKDEEAAAFRDYKLGKLDPPEDFSEGGRIGFSGGGAGLPAATGGQTVFIGPTLAEEEEDEEEIVVQDPGQAEEIPMPMFGNFETNDPKEAAKRIAMEYSERFGARQQSAPLPGGINLLFGMGANRPMDIGLGMQKGNFSGGIGSLDGNVSAGINYTRYFEEGGPVDPDRRTFVKILGGLASIPILGKFVTPLKQVAPVVAETAKEVPAYFFKLVDKIRRLGDDAPGLTSIERESGKRYKNYEMVEDQTTGDIIIKKQKQGSTMVGDDMVEGTMSEEVLAYRTPKNTPEGRLPADYEEITVKPDFEGKMRDVEDGLDSMSEILEEVGEAQLKKAGGGLAYMLGE